MNESVARRLSASPNYKWYIVGMLWFMAFFNYADRQAVFSVFPLLEKEMGLSDVELGLVGSSFAWVYGLGAPFAGYIIDRVRRKTAILAGLYAWSVICMATAVSQRFWHLIFFRAAEGLGETFYFPASMSLISDYHDKRTRSRAMGLHQTSVYVGTIAGGFFAGWIGQEYGWRWSFIVFGGLGIVLGVVLHRLVIEPARGAADYASVHAESEAGRRKLPVGEVLKHIFSTPSAIVLLLAFLCANFVGVVLLSWMPKFLHDEFGMSLAMSGLTATIYVQLASLVAAPLGGWMADGLRKRTTGGRMMVQALGVFGGAPFVALCGMAETFSTDTRVTALIVALTAWGFFKGLYDANIFASVYDVIEPEARGSAAGLMNMIGWLGGGGTAPIIIGIISQSKGLGFAIATASLVYVLAGLLLVVGIVFFIRNDAQRLQTILAAKASSGTA